MCTERESSYYISVVARALPPDSSKMYKKIKTVPAVYYTSALVFVAPFKCILYEANNLPTNVSAVFFGIFSAEPSWNMWHDAHTGNDEYRWFLVLFSLTLCCKTPTPLDPWCSDFAFCLDQCFQFSLRPAHCRFLYSWWEWVWDGLPSKASWPAEHVLKNGFK